MSQQVSNHVESSHAGTTNWIVVALLAAILATQVVILLRMPASPPVDSVPKLPKIPRKIAQPKVLIC